MNDGPLSPDGRHQWNGEKWEKIPSTPMTAHAWFQVAAIVVFVTLVVAVLSFAFA